MAIEARSKVANKNLKNPLEETEWRRQKLLSEPIVPLMIEMSGPIILGMSIMVIYNLTDTFFVGLLNDKSMTAAVGIVFSFVSSIQALGFWFGYGSGNRMAKKLGKNEKEEAMIIASLGIACSIITGIFLAIVSWIFLSELVQFMGGNASGSVVAFTSQYLQILTISIPFSLFSITLYNQLRLCGNVKDGMIGLLVGMGSNIILTPIMMFTMKVGFIGAGYATLAGQMIGAIALGMRSYRKGYSPISWKAVSCTKERLYHILVGGMPNFSRQAITSISLVLVNRVVANFGDASMAALTISARIVAVVYMIMIGWGQAFQPICAMNVGAKKYDRVQSAFMVTVLVGTVFLSISAGTLYSFSELFMSLMSTDRQVIFIGTQLLKIQCISIPFLAYFAVSSMLMQNIGQYFWALIISISRQGIFYLPLLYILPILYGEYGIYLLQPASDIVSFIVAFIIVRKIGIPQKKRNKEDEKRGDVE